MSIETKSTFGVTFNPRMGGRKMAKLWFNEVKPEIRDKYPDLNAAMEECRIANIQEDTKEQAKFIKVEIEKQAEAAVNAAAAIIAMMFQVPAQIAAAMAALQERDLSVDLSTLGKSKIHLEIDKILPDYIT